MTLNTQKTVTTGAQVVNVEANALAALLNGGWIDILDGAQPANGDTAITTQNLLVSLQFGSPAFGAASGGVATANSITQGVIGQSGIATWCRIYEADHATAVFDGSVGTAAANLVLNSTNLQSGAFCSCTGFTFTVAAATAGS